MNTSIGLKNMAVIILTALLGLIAKGQTIKNVNPDTGLQKQTLTVTISGENTFFSHATSTSAIWFQQGTSTFIYPNSINKISDTKISGDFTIKYNTPVGKYDVKVRYDSNNEITYKDGFTVLPALKSSIAITPDTARQKQTLIVTISGDNSHFAQATSTADIWFQQSTSTFIFPNYIQTVSDETIKAEFTFNFDTPPGKYDVNTFNPTDGLISLADGFTILPSLQEGKLTSVNPSTARQGEALVVSISGENTNFSMATNTVVWMNQGEYFAYTLSSPNILNNNQVNGDFYFGYDIPPGYYNVNVYNTIDGTLSKEDAFYLQAAPPYIDTQPQSATVCEGDYVMFFVNAIGTSLTFQWKQSSDAGNSWSNIADANLSYLVINNVTTAMNNTLFMCIVTGSENLNSISDTALLTVHPNPDAEILTQGAFVLCMGDEVMLKAKTDDEYAYQWSRNSSIINNAIGDSYTATQSGIYTLIVTNKWGCSAYSQQIEVKDKFEIDIGDDRFICGNDSVKLDAGDGYASYLWSNGDTTQKIAFDSAGYYNKPAKIYVIVTDSDGCSVKDSILVVFGYCVSANDMIKNEAGIRVFPNPSNGLINIACENIKGESELILNSLGGQRILRKKYYPVDNHTLFQLDIRGLPAGIYIMTFKSNNLTAYRKIIVN